MSSSKILAGKRAVVFGAGGSIGAAVAMEFAAEGAEVFLSGRNASSVDEVRRRISDSGGTAQAAVIDALDHRAVEKYVDTIVRETGGVDIEFNAVGPRAGDYGNGKHAVELSVDEFMLPVATILKSAFITARAAARHMLRQRSGVILFLTGSPARGHVEGATAIGAAFGAIETLVENLAVELSPSGIRVVCLRTTANVDSRTIQDTMEALASRLNTTREAMTAQMAGLNFLRLPARTSDTARAAALLASDRFRLLTGTVVNSTAGAALD
jgi:NAD(P)-dependent dehydrogenase (short-subunit alcohol dehydrogenase family)